MDSATCYRKCNYSWNLCGETGQRIEIKGWIQEDVIYISIRDHGIGMSSDVIQALQHDLAHHAVKLAKHGNKVGLFNVQSRLLLNYGESFGIHIENIVRDDRDV